MARFDVYSKVKFASLKDIAKMALPVLAIVLAMVVDMVFPTVYPEGYVEACYPIFLRICIVVYLVFAVLSCWFEKLRAHVVHFWGLFTAFFVLMAIYDYMTLKTGNAVLPYYPSVDQIIEQAVSNAELLGGYYLNSMALMLQGLAMGACAGLIYGTLMGYSRAFNYWLAPFLKLIGPVPSTAWMAIAMVLSPSNHMAACFLIAITVWFPLSVNLSGAIKGIDKTYLERARIMGASTPYILWHVIMPASLPGLFTGLFMGFCNSLTSLVTAELLGVQGGLGYYFAIAESWVAYDILFGIVVIFIVTAFVMITILFKVQSRVMKWSKGAIQW